MTRSKFFTTIFNETLQKYGHFKTWVAVVFGILVIFNQEVVKPLNESWKGIPVPWVTLIIVLLFGFVFYLTIYEKVKDLLESKLDLAFLREETFEYDFTQFVEPAEESQPSSPFGPQPIELPFRLFRVYLKNEGGTLVRNIKVRLIKIEPNPGLPTPLDLKKMHDNPADKKSFKQDFEFSPDHHDFFDVFLLERGKTIRFPYIEITHSNRNVIKHIPRDNYMFTIQVTGDTPISKTIDLALSLSDSEAPTLEML